MTHSQMSDIVCIVHYTSVHNNWINRNCVCLAFLLYLRNNKGRLWAIRYRIWICWWHMSNWHLVCLFQHIQTIARVRHNALSCFYKCHSSSSRCATRRQMPPIPHLFYPRISCFHPVSWIIVILNVSDAVIHSTSHGSHSTQKSQNTCSVAL